MHRRAKRSLLVKDAALFLIELAQPFLFRLQIAAPAVPVLPGDNRDDARFGTRRRPAVSRLAREHLDANLDLIARLERHGLALREQLLGLEDEPAAAERAAEDALRIGRGHGVKLHLRSALG